MIMRTEPNEPSCLEHTLSDTCKNLSQLLEAERIKHNVTKAELAAARKKITQLESELAQPQDEYTYVTSD